MSSLKRLKKKMSRTFKKPDDQLDKILEEKTKDNIAYNEKYRNRPKTGIESLNYPGPTWTGMFVRCQCGDVNFKTLTEPPIEVFICHCNECRLQSGSAFGVGAIFPKFPGIPCKDKMTSYERISASGNKITCWFCKRCGTRVIHERKGAETINVKGGCIRSLNYKNARHIWCKDAVVPIPPGVRRDQEEPTECPTIQPQPQPQPLSNITNLHRYSTPPCITAIDSSSGPSTSNTSTSTSNFVDIDNGKGKEKAVEKETMEPRTESMRLLKRQVEEQARKEEHEKKRVSFVTAHDVLVDRVVRLGKAKEIAC